MATVLQAAACTRIETVPEPVANSLQVMEHGQVTNQVGLEMVKAKVDDMSMKVTQLTAIVTDMAKAFLRNVPTPQGPAGEANDPSNHSAEAPLPHAPPPQNHPPPSPIHCATSAGQHNKPVAWQLARGVKVIIILQRNATRITLKFLINKSLMVVADGGRCVRRVLQRHRGATISPFREAGKTSWLEDHWQRKVIYGQAKSDCR